MDTYIVAAKRTAIASFIGSLKSSSAVSLQATVIQEILSSSGIDPGIIDELIIGNVLQAGSGQGPGRQAAIHAGIPETVPAYTINMICGSGLKSIMLAESEIKSGRFHCLVAGGVEHMSSAPYLVAARQGNKLGNMTLIDSVMHDGLTDAFQGYPMGITAENIAERYNISREDQDEFAYQSQQRALTAIDQGIFADEIVPIEIKQKRETLSFHTDEFPNRTSSPEKLASLRPVFKEGGTVSAGNSSGINDGASGVIVMSEEALRRTEAKPLARIIASAEIGIDPAIMGMGPLQACKNLMDKSGIGIEDIGLIELNEAFAAQSLAVIRELAASCNVDSALIMEKTNVNGGAIALGHPIGCSGNRIVVSLIHEMHRRKLRYGMATLCIGGGMGLAMLLERVE